MVTLQPWEKYGKIWKTMEKYMEKYGFMNFHGFSMVFKG